MKECKKCNGAGEITVPVEEHLGTVLYGKEQCDECDGTGEVQTNEEWIRQCNTEQLAEFLCNVGFENETIVRKFKSEWAKWLKEKHGESE